MTYSCLTTAPINQQSIGTSFDDIQGSYSPGTPIRIVDMDNPGPSIQAELEKQSSQATRLAIGLTQVQLGQSETSLDAFEKAAEIDPCSAIAQFFIGRENLFLSDRYPDQRTVNQLAAEDAFQKAITLDEGYARASIGLGSIYMNRAADLVNSAPQSDQPVDSQALLWADQAAQSYQHVLDMNPTTEQYGNPVSQVAMMGLGNAYRLTGNIAAESNFIDCNFDLATLPSVEVDSPPPPPPPSSVQTSDAEGGCGPDFGNPDCKVTISDDFLIQFQLFEIGQELTEANGVKQINFEVRLGGENGETIHETVESTSAYCIFGGNGPCNNWPVDGNAYIWPSGKPLTEGKYFIEIFADYKDANFRWAADFEITLP